MKNRINQTSKNYLALWMKLFYFKLGFYVFGCLQFKARESISTSAFRSSEFIPSSSITMPPRLPRVAIAPSRVARLSIAPKLQQLCPICSVSRALRPLVSNRRPSQLLSHRIRSRQQSNTVAASATNRESPITPKNARVELRDALADLQKQAGSYVNISRLQLALRGLEQPVGQETIRIAILGLGDDGSSMKRAKEVLRLLVADPLKAEEEWERILREDDVGSRPLLLKVGHNGGEEGQQSTRLVEEFNVSSPLLNGHKLEILVLETEALSREGIIDQDSLTDALLVPTMEIPTSSTGRYTPVTTPVHKSLLVANGILGAAKLYSYPLGLAQHFIGAAVNLRSMDPEDRKSLRFQVIDIEKGSAALDSFRRSVDNALEYEKDWFASGMPELLQWLKYGTAPTDGAMKEPLWNLIDSLLKNTSKEVEHEQMRQLAAALSAKVTAPKLRSLREGLSQWAERAHTELCDSLDIAFNGRRWRKLGWWKLFWRVDDVSMIASDILNQRFLRDAEREVIYLAGVIDEALSKDNPVTFDKNWAYKPVVEQEETGILKHAPPPRIQDLIEAKDDSPAKIKPQPWPLEIPTTRALLAADTIPALQALAQKLVLQTLTTSGFSTAFAGLIYVSTLSTSLYEAGAVAALGIVWSLRRMQGKWETARKFWEGEVREEGRKAVRGVESVVTNALVQTDRPLEGAEELEEAKEALRKAEIALEKCK